MMENQSIVDISVIWRDEHIKVEMNADSNVKEFGQKLQKLTNIRADTMRLLVPQSTNKGSKLITPFSDEHSSLTLQETAILEGKPIRMMGVFEHEIEEVSQNNVKSDLRIVGFDEEERRLRQRLLNTPQASLKLPQGAYIFCDFHTLHLPGIELSPPASEALRIMHMLACDPGIIAIMNKHRWCVGIMTEMAPEGYVGISPKCLLGFNKNQGEEISLRLRTDDLKGFRKYESIKKTLLHELAHMVYSEHDANFYALDKQLNQEAVSLDWTKSRSQTLSGQKISGHYEDERHVGPSSGSIVYRLGGRNVSPLTTARAASVAAAYDRLLSAVTNNLEGSQVQVESTGAGGTTTNAHYVANVEIEPDPDDSELKAQHQKDLPELNSDNALVIEKDDMQVDTIVEVDPSSTPSVPEAFDEPDPDDCLNDQNMFESDPNDSLVGGNTDSCREPNPDDSQVLKAVESYEETDPDDSKVRKTVESYEEPDPDDSGSKKIDLAHMEPDPDDCEIKEIIVEPRVIVECNPVNSLKNETLKVEPDPDDSMVGSNNKEIQRIEEPATVISTRLKKAIEMLRSEVTPVETTSSLQTLFKIIRNVIDHPDDVKFRKLRKANPLFQRNVANYKAAMEVLKVIGFREDVTTDELGRRETYLVLRRNDPGLLWLAKSSLEVSIS